MRIGAFAKKHNISVDTVRYYLDLQLLLAEKDGAQYRFTEEDSKDLKEIMELKKLKFSLGEIQKILTYKRLASNKAIDFKEHFMEFLEEKKRELLSKKEELDEILNFINGKIEEVDNELRNLNVLGLPIRALDKLICPYCKGEFDLTEGQIEHNMIISGKLNCKCNSNLYIENGIIIDEKAIAKKNLPTKKEYYEKTSPKFINFLFKSMTNIINIINDEDVKKDYILEVSHCCGFFLMNYIPYLPKDSTFIIVEQDLNRLKNLKYDLGLHHHHDKFIFLCFDYNNLPLRENSIDLILDCFTSSIHSKIGEDRLFKFLNSLLKPGGKYAGIYSYYANRNLDSSGIEYYCKERLLEAIRTINLNKIYIKEEGPVEEGGEFNPGVVENKYSNLIYFGKKVAN
ncbi:MAG: MerR family transcriptional regulator [Tissierellia bacterium]|nr:MerR family transcriptional regulator [Tissierellia bacterium]